MIIIKTSPDPMQNSRKVYPKWAEHYQREVQREKSLKEEMDQYHKMIRSLNKNIPHQVVIGFEPRKPGMK